MAFNVIAPDYFSTLGTPLIAGREFNDRDTATAPPVAIVNESFARSFFGTEAAIGRRVTSVGVTYEIVGVVRDAKYQDLREGVDEDDVHRVDAAETDEQPTRYSYVARVTGGDPMRLSSAVERVVRESRSLAAPGAGVDLRHDHRPVDSSGAAHGHRWRSDGPARAHPRRRRPVRRPGVSGGAPHERAGRAHGARREPMVDDAVWCFGTSCGWLCRASRSAEASR